MKKKKMKIKTKNKTIEVGICNNFFLKSKGLMFSKKIQDNKGLLFVFDGESKFGKSIHMLFVFYPINVFWLDKNYVVVDKVLAKPFRLYYAPKKACQYILETNSSIDINIGEKLKLY